MFQIDDFTENPSVPSQTVGESSLKKDLQLKNKMNYMFCVFMKKEG